MTFANDLRYALRTIRRTPVFAAISILALALGIGANTALFTFMDATLNRALPYPGSDRIVGLSPYNKARTLTGPSSIPDFLDWQKQSRSFEAMTGVQPASFTLATESGPERLEGLRGTAAFFRVFGVAAALGRTFRDGEDHPDHPPAVVLSHGCWQRRFGARPEVVGSHIVLDGRKTEVIGIMGPDFRFPNPSFDFYSLLPLDVVRSPRGALNTRVFARLKPAVALETAQAELDTIAAQLAALHTENRGYKIALYRLAEFLASGPRKGIVVLMAACLLVLLIACANVANLMLARSSVRTREIAIRRALGASRTRILSQVLIESILIALAGGLVGVFLAFWGVDLLMLTLPPMLHPQAEVRINAPALLFALILSTATGLLFGIAPAWHASRTDPNETLKEGGRSNTASRPKGWLRAALVVAEVALCSTLLVGSGVLMNTLARIQNAPLGFDPSSMLTMQLSLTSGKYPNPEHRVSFANAILDRVRGVQGVENAAIVTALPLASGLAATSFSIDGRASDPNERVYVRHSAVTSAFFETMRIPILRGRSIQPYDRAGAPLVAVVNDTMARRYWPNEDPVGKRFKLGAGNADAPWRTIVGVARDVRHSGLDSEILPAAWFPYAQESSGYIFLVARTPGVDPASLAKLIGKQIVALDPQQPLAQVRTMTKVISDAVMVGRTLSRLLMFLGGVALLLAVTGIYGVISYSVSQRTHEMVVRLAMGASRIALVSMVVRQALWLSLTGLLLGAAGAFPFTRLLQSVVSGATQVEPIVVAVVALVLILAAIAGSIAPARRASSLDPISALRCD